MFLSREDKIEMFTHLQLNVSADTAYLEQKFILKYYDILLFVKVK